MDKPIVRLNCAMSLDGFIGKAGKKIRFSNDEDKRRVHRLRARMDGIMVGLNTILTDNPHLTVRHVKGRNPVRIIVDGLGRTPLDAYALNAEAPAIVAVSRKAPSYRVKKLREKAEVIIVGSDLVDLSRLMKALYKRNIRSILLEGGGTLIHSMLSEGLVDEISLAIAPVLLGDGIRWINGTLKKQISLEYAGCRILGNQVVVHYKVK
jgi:2,5-diamino-6-hydroxy-4-(5-phosphoribosylamino)pyrimidine 1'-reductase